MNLRFHGGRCCGVKTLTGFTLHPNRELPAMDPVADRSRHDVDQRAGHVNSDESFFTIGAPKETMIERLDRLIEFCKQKRPRGLIEAYLTSGFFNFCESEAGYEPSSQDALWGPILRERGFVPVTSFINSNSGAVVTVYHFTTGV